MAMETAFCRTISGYTTKKRCKQTQKITANKKKLEEAEWLSILSAGLATEATQKRNKKMCHLSRNDVSETFRAYHLWFRKKSGLI